MKKLNTFMIATISATLATSIYADKPELKQYHIQGLYNSKKVPNAQNLVLCVKKGTKSQNTQHPQSSNQGFEKWDSGEQSPFKISQNAYYFGAAVRAPASGDKKCTGQYYGYLNVNRNNDGFNIQYKPAKGTHIGLKQESIDVNDHTLKGKLGFSKIGSASDDFPTNHQNPDKTHWFTGVNLSGFEFSRSPNPTVIPNLSVEDADHKYSDLAATKQFLNQGANTIRLPIRWAYIQPYGPSDNMPNIGESYFTELYIPAVKKLVDHGYFVIVDLHAYMHYSTVGAGVAGCGPGATSCPDGKLKTKPQHYVNVWSNILQQLKDANIDTKHLLIDIVNEPATKTQVKHNLKPKIPFTMQMKVIAHLYKNGFKGRYLVEGADWTGLHSWEQSGNAEQFTRENMLAALENNGLSQAKAEKLINNKIIINVHQYFDSDYSGTHKGCQTDLSTTGKKGFNLNAFKNYLKKQKLKAMVTEFGVGNKQSQCQTALNKFLKDHVNKHHYTPKKGYGYVGWTAWSTGHGWGDYKLRIKPDDWKANTLKQYYKLNS